MQTPDSGDYIGVESCADLKSEFDAAPPRLLRIGNRRASSRRGSAEKAFPPPIPWLARTENLPSHMPWVMRRYRTDDGRLIIREERAPRHEFFAADRSNGRLVLKLVPLDYYVVEESCCHVGGLIGEKPGGGCDEGCGGGDSTVEAAEFCSSMYDERGMTPCGGFAVDAAAVAAALRPPVSSI